MGKKSSPRMLKDVLKSIARLDDRNGSSIRSILGDVQGRIGVNTKYNNRELVTHVRRAIKHGLSTGLFEQHGQRFRLDLKDHKIFKNPHNSDIDSRKYREDAKNHNPKSRTSKPSPLRGFPIPEGKQARRRRRKKGDDAPKRRRRRRRRRRRLALSVAPSNDVNDIGENANDENLDLNCNDANCECDPQNDGGEEYEEYVE